MKNDVTVLLQRVTTTQRMDESTVLDAHSSIVSLLLPSFHTSVINSISFLTYSLLCFSFRLITSHIGITNIWSENRQHKL